LRSQGLAAGGDPRGEAPSKPPKFKIGQLVEKWTGDYTGPGRIRGIAHLESATASRAAAANSCTSMLVPFCGAPLRYVKNTLAYRAK
jgi:hypothetical protein